MEPSQELYVLYFTTVESNINTPQIFTGESVFIVVFVFLLENLHGCAIWLSEASVCIVDTICYNSRHTYCMSLVVEFSVAAVHGTENDGTAASSVGPTW